MKGKISVEDRISLWISLIVPSFITSLVDFDISIFVTYSLAASVLGIKTIWLILFVYIIAHVVNGTSGKVVIVSNKGLVELIREHFGIATSFYIFIITLILNFIAILQGYLAIKTIASLFNLNYLFFAFALTVYLLMVFIFKLQKFANRVFVLIALFYTSVFIYSVMNPSSVINALLFSRLKFIDLFKDQTALYFLALLGSTTSAWNQLLISRYTYRTKLDLDRLEYHKLNNRTTSLFSLFFSILFVVTMTLLFPNGSLLSSPVQELTRFIPIGQYYVRIFLFGFGLLTIALVNIYAVSLSLSHVFTEFFGIERKNEEQEEFTKTHNYLFLLLTIPALIITDVFHINLFSTAVIFGFIQALFIFVLLYFLYFFSNHQTLMGKYKSDLIHNLLMISIAVFLGLIFTFVIFKTILRL